MQALYYVDILVITLLHNTVGGVLCRYLCHYFAEQYCRQRTMQISWSLLCCTIMQAAYYVDILVITLLHNTLGSVKCSYLGHYFPAKYCRQCSMEISWSLLCCTILQAEYYVDILVITLLHNTVGSVLFRYLGHYFAAQYCSSVLCRYLGRYFAVQYCRQRKMQISWSLLCCTILQAAYYVDILVITLLHNIVGSVQCRYVSRYFAAQYFRQRTMQISWSLLCCTILQTQYHVDIVVITLLHNTVGSVKCRYPCHYFASQYCSQRPMQISWSLLCCTILQAAYSVDMLVVTLLYNIVDSVLCRYLGRYFTAQYCRQRTMQISWSILCCTMMQAAYYIDILVISLLHNTVGSVLCRYLGHYFAAQYYRQRTMLICQSLLCCTILWTAYYVDILVITLLYNTVHTVLCRYLGRYFATQYCRQSTMQISYSLLCCTILLHNTVGSVLFRYVGHYFAAHYCRQRTMQMSWSLLCCTILQASYYVDIFVTTLLYNTVGSVQCRYVGRYFAAQYCGPRTMLISWSLFCCTIMQAAYYVDILFITLLHNIEGSVLCRYLGHYFFCTILQAVYYVDRYLGHYFAAQYCRQCTMQIFWSFFCCTLLQAAYYIDIFLLLCCTILLHNTVGSVLYTYLCHYFLAQYCRQRSMQISWSLLCCTILLAAFYVDILVITLLHNNVSSVLCRYLGHYLAAQYCRLYKMYISWLLLRCTIFQPAYYVDILVITLLHNIVGNVLFRYLGHYFAAQYCRQQTIQISCPLL